MRNTQGCFSFLPDLTDRQISAQVQYCIDQGWAVNIEFTDDPHPRNTYWEMWGIPMFDIPDAAAVMHELTSRAGRRMAAAISASPPSMPARAGNRCGSPSWSTGRRWSRASRPGAAGSRGLRSIRYTTRLVTAAP